MQLELAAKHRAVKEPISPVKQPFLGDETALFNSNFSLLFKRFGV